MDLNFPDVVLRQGGNRRCRVLYSYSPQNDDELQLQVNDEIDFLDEVEDGWWKGKLGNKIGVFPSNFVCDLTNEESCHSEGEGSISLSALDSAMIVEEAPVLPPKPVKETCRVLFSYDAANDDELTLRKDDIITVITKEVEDKGWWKGELRGKIGLFPDNFVELITQSDEIFLGQSKKPDRPAKTFDKIESKIQHTSTPGFQKMVQDNSNTKNLEEKILGSKGEGSFIKKNSHNMEKIKSESGTKFAEKNLNLFQPKNELTTINRKSLETKSGDNQVPTSVAKKPILPPPLTNKPKPTTGKSSNVKRLSEEINDLIENSGTANKSPKCLMKKLSGEVHDLVDGGISSKLGCMGQSPIGGLKEDLDLDSIERSDMLTHITSSRPRPPGRRLPSKEAKESESHICLTNGSFETADKEKNQREREWEKHKPPWVNELKLNLKSNKSSPNDSKFDKKSTSSVKSSPQSPIEVSSSAAAPESLTATVLVRQFSPQLGGPRTQSMFETVPKVSELSSKFSLSEKSKAVTPVSPSKPMDISNNALDHSIDEVVQISRKEFTELKYKVNTLAELVMQLTAQLAEEVDKRKIIEKELNKLTDLVTQV